MSREELILLARTQAEAIAAADERVPAVEAQVAALQLTAPPNTRRQATAGWGQDHAAPPDRDAAPALGSGRGRMRVARGRRSGSGSGTERAGADGEPRLRRGEVVDRVDDCVDAPGRGYSLARQTGGFPSGY